MKTPTERGCHSQRKVTIVEAIQSNEFSRVNEYTNRDCVTI